MSRINYFLILFIFLGLTSFAQSDKEIIQSSEKITETNEETKQLATDEKTTQPATDKKEISCEISPESSRISWTAFKPLGEHTGEISVKSGNLIFVDTLLTGGEIIVDMTSITCTDIEDEENNAKLVGHLKSADFFDVDTFNTAKLVIKKVIPYGTFDTKYDASTGQVYKAVADLTIKAITKEVKFKVNLYKYNTGNGSVSGTTRIEIDRSDFDVKYGSGSFFDNLGDKVIYDEFRLDVSVGGKLN